MVKGRLPLPGGRAAFFFGLSDGNLMKLREKKPIQVNLRTIGGPNIEVVIAWGETEDAIYRELEENGMSLPRPA